MATHSSAGLPPGPDGLPFLGNTHQLARGTLGFYERATEEYGDLVRIDVGGDEGVIVAHPDYVERILVEDHDRYVKGEMLEDTLGPVFENGMFLAEGEQWRAQRGVAQPAFYRERIMEYADAVVDHATAVDWSHAGTVDLLPETSDLTLSVLTDALFGFDDADDRAVVRDAAVAITQRLDVSRPSAHLPLWVPTPTNRRFRRRMDRLVDVVDERVERRRREDDAGSDLLSMLANATSDGELADETVRDDLITFLFAGHETTALGLTYALHLLATNPDEQERLRDELDDVLGRGADGRRPTAADLADLEFTERVIDEALRLYPPVYTFFREPVEDVEFGGYRIPEGTVLSLPQWIVHRDERWWDDPEAFDPDRWTRDRDRPEYAYYPFGGGPRHCIGMRLARLELRLALATLCSTYRFEAITTEFGMRPSANLRPADPVEVRVRRR